MERLILELGFDKKMVFGNTNDMVFNIPLLCIHVIGREKQKIITIIIIKFYA
jgi:hypothetical protein